MNGYDRFNTVYLNGVAWCKTWTVYGVTKIYITWTGYGVTQCCVT